MAFTPWPVPSVSHRDSRLPRSFPQACCLVSHAAPGTSYVQPERPGACPTSSSPRRPVILPLGVPPHHRHPGHIPTHLPPWQPPHTGRPLRLLNSLPTRVRPLNGCPVPAVMVPAAWLTRPGKIYFFPLPSLASHHSRNSAHFPGLLRGGRPSPPLITCVGSDLPLAPHCDRRVHWSSLQLCLAKLLI